MTTYIVNSSDASKGNFFERTHVLNEIPDNTPFTYDKDHNVDGVYGKIVIEAESEFNAGINFVRDSFDFEALSELIAIAEFYANDCEELSDLIIRLEFFMSAQTSDDDGGGEEEETQESTVFDDYEF